jgi:RNA polymerase sigma-70 factor (ECF subfamily)
MDPDDERLAVEAAQKDPSRFGELYERYFERVYSFVVLRVRDRAEAEDVTAEVFQRALTGLPGFEWRGAPFGTWLFRIAANAIVDRGRRAAREVPVPDTSWEPAAAPEAERVDRHADVFRFVHRLPDDQKRVIVERFVDGRSIREIAQRLNRTEGAIKQLQFRALQTLRTLMETADA